MHVAMPRSSLPATMLYSGPKGKKGFPDNGKSLHGQMESGPTSWLLRIGLELGEGRHEEASTCQHECIHIRKQRKSGEVNHNRPVVGIHATLEGQLSQSPNNNNIR